MRNLLPSEVVEVLRDRYLAGVADAEAQFFSAVADEDALTGALGQSIARQATYYFQVENDQYSVSISWKKIRGRGLNAPERLYGPDGVFQLAVLDNEEHVIGMKALPFQAKTRWHGTSKAVAKQSADIESSLGGGILINFTEHGYEACTTKAALTAKGSRGVVKSMNGLRPLGQLLGGDFLDCTIGHQGLFFDPTTERFFGSNLAGEVDLLPPANAITTIVRKASAREG